jgi:uncharacterized membrane protein YqjE
VEMATRSSNGAGLSDAVREFADHATAMARLELRLAANELRRKIAQLGAGVGLILTAGMFVALALMTVAAAGIAALSLVLPVWAALLVGAGGLFVLAGASMAIGVWLVRRSSPPVPEQAIREAKLTTEALKNGDH